MPLTPLTQAELLQHIQDQKYPSRIFLATNPEYPSGMGHYNIDDYLSYLNIGSSNSSNSNVVIDCGTFLNNYNLLIDCGGF